MAALGSIDHTGEFVRSGKFAVLGRNSAGDLLQLGMVGQVVVNAHEEFVEFRGYRRHGASTTMNAQLCFPAIACLATAWMSHPAHEAVKQAETSSWRRVARVGVEKTATPHDLPCAFGERRAA